MYKGSFKKDLAEKQVLCPCVWDCLSTRAVELCGYDAALISGAAVAENVIGCPDLGIMTIDELVWVTEKVAGYANIPIIVDADEGYGDSPLNVARNVERLLRAYGLEPQVFAIPNCLFVSITTPQGHPITRLCRIPAHGTDIELLERCNDLCRSLCRHPVPVDQAARLVEELSGRGVRAQVDGKTVCAGNDKLMDSMGVKWRPCHHVGTIVHVAVDGQYRGHIVISDEVKGDAKQAIAALKAQGVRKTVMLTGDTKTVGEAVARDLGLDEVYTQLLPGEKVAKVEALLEQKSSKGKLAFVGDGINDAPVLSRADIGIAMGALGSDAAIEAADIVLMDDKPSKIALAMQISKRTLRIVRQNIVFALAVKIVVLALTPFGLSNMWEAVFADVGVMVIAILNASRALKAGKK